MIIGLRHETGGDWFNYRAGFDSFTDGDLYSAIENIGYSDPSYALLSWISPSFGGFHFVNFVCGCLFMTGLISFCRTQPSPWLALTIAVPYLVIVVAIGYTRQGVAIGFTMIGLVALSHGNLKAFLLSIVVAASFHKSAVILIPLALFSSQGRIWSALLGVGVLAPVTFVIFLQDSLDRVVSGYIGDAYESSGALIRVAMNALPAFIFLVWRGRFELVPAQRSFWTWIALGAIAFVVLLIVSPSSTAVDRVALYWIPLQMFVLSRVPDAFGQPGSANTIWTYTIVFYSATVHFVWLFFATHSNYWLPYQFYPWVLLWH
ncbi:MAG: EpsG family protein [Gammaproteobacteria bacterium]|nr:EpsG family protein [Gammaproteobacteria bacterium]